MKKLVTLIVGTVATLQSFSQLALGVQGTGNLSDAKIEAADLYSPTKKTRVLPGAGIVADVTLSPSLMLRTGLNYQQQGITIKATFPGVPGEIDEIKSEAKLNLQYLQVPLNILYTTKGTTQFYFGGGPYISVGVSGNSKVVTTYKFSDGSTETEKEESNVFEKDEEGNRMFNRTDYGVGAIAGVKLPGGLFANVGYQYSFANLSKAEESTYRNRGLQLTVGYYLWKR